MKDRTSQGLPFFMQAGSDAPRPEVQTQEAGAGRTSCAEASCQEHHSHPVPLQGRAEIAFPCEFTIKAIGLQADDLAAHTHSLIVKHAPDLKLEQLQFRASSKGKYLSVSAVINAVSREQLDNIYRELNSDPRILYTL